jgi:hypothetical protein
MKPAVSSFANSFLMASLLSRENRRSCCFLGVAFRSTFRQCLIKSLGTPGISAGFHINMSRLALRKLTSASSYLPFSLALMSAILNESPSYSWMVFMPMLLVLGFTIDWPSFFCGGTAGITISNWESCCAAVNTSDEGSGMRVVEAYSIASCSQS